MAPKYLYALLFTPSPPAADIVRSDKVTGPFEKGKLVDFECFLGKEKGKSIFETTKGEILYIGLKKQLELIFLSPDKTIVPSKEEGIQARRQELGKLLMQQAKSTEIHLHELDQAMLTQGPSGAAKHQSVSKPINRLAKVPDVPRKRELQERFKNLECWKTNPLKTNLFKKCIYVCPYKIARYKRKYALKPKMLYKKVLTLLATRKLLAEEGVSARGKKGCVGVPKRISEIALAYALTVYQESGGDLKTVIWDPDTALESHITYCRRVERGEQTSTDSSVSDDEEMEVENIDENGLIDDTDNPNASPRPHSPVTTTEPVTTGLVTTELVTTEPVTTEPVTTEPVTTELVTTGPVPTGPVNQLEANFEYEEETMDSNNNFTNNMTDHSDDDSELLSIIPLTPSIFTKVPDEGTIQKNLSYCEL